MTFFFSGGIFKLYLKFSESYNLSPPEVFFITIPYHPNGKEEMTNDWPTADATFLGS